MKARLILPALLFAVGVSAQTYRWVDRDGKLHYGDRPPPTADRLAVRKPAAPPADKTPPAALRRAQEDFPVTLYVSANCTEGCQEGRDYLKTRGIPFREKSVKSPEDMAALGQLTGGEAVVPVLTVGPKTARGWLREDWQRLLDAAGYPKAP